MAGENQAAAIHDLVETALANEDIAPLVGLSPAWDFSMPVRRCLGKNRLWQHHINNKAEGCYAMPGAVCV